MTTLNFGVIEVFKSTLYTRHKVDLELNFGRTYSFSWKFQNMVWINFPSSMSRENSPLICAYKFSWIPSTHIYIWNFWRSFPYKWKSRQYKIQDIYDMNFNMVSTTSQPHLFHPWINLYSLSQMKLLIHKPLSLITKTRIRGLDAFNLPLFGNWWQH